MAIQSWSANPPLPPYLASPQSLSDSESDPPSPEPSLSVSCVPGEQNLFCVSHSDRSPVDACISLDISAGAVLVKDLPRSRLHAPISSHLDQPVRVACVIVCICSPAQRVSECCVSTVWWWAGTSYTRGDTPLSSFLVVKRVSAQNIAPLSSL